MDLSKRGLAVAILLAGCSGEIGDATPPPVAGAKDPSKPAQAASNGDDSDPTPAVMPGQVVNDDGTITITKEDGSTTIVTQDGMVISESPPTVTGDQADPTAPPALAEDGETEIPAAKPS